MAIELWGFEGTFHIGFPARITGYFVLGLVSLALFGLLYSDRKSYTRQISPLRNWHWPLFVGLILVAPLASQTFLTRLPVTDTTLSADAAPGLRGPVFALFGALPWMVSGGLLGIWQSVVVGFVGGLARGGWETGSILTPLNMAFQAGLVTWLIRRDYAGWSGRLARSPLFSGILGGLSFGILRGVEFFVYTEGNLYDSLDLSFAILGPTLLAAIIETGFAGVVSEAARRASTDAWYQPRREISPPYLRSLTTRLLIVFSLLCLVASGVLLYGDWMLARQSARDLVEKQMRQTASQASGNIPFFIQTGRSFSRQIADDIASLAEGTSLTPELLATRLRRFSFFDQLAVFGTQAQLLATYPPVDDLEALMSSEVEAGLEASAEGVPSEVMLHRSQENKAVRLAFLSPVQPSSAEKPVSVVVGWTELLSNPYLLPVISSLEMHTPGEAYLTDEFGRVLVYAEESMGEQVFDLASLSDGEIHIDTTPGGIRRLIYMETVVGYPWRVVVTMPLREVQRQALQMSLRLTAVLLVVGGALVFAVYALSRRLTQPLRSMAEAAQAIARGDLAQLVPSAGEDEIGMLASSFERMRRGLKTRLDEMALLLEVSRQVATTFELFEVLPPILEGIQSVAEADLVRLALVPVTDGSQDSIDSYQAGEDPGNWGTLDSQIMALCRERGRFTLENPARARAVLDLEALTEPMESLAALPLKHKDEFVGVLWLGHEVPHSFAQDEFNLLSILAGQLGVAVANARLYQRAEQEWMRLVAVINATPDAVIVIDHEGRISLLNPAAAGLLHVEAEETIGIRVEELPLSTVLKDLLLKPEQGERATEIEIESGRVMFASVSDIQLGRAMQSSRVWVLWDVTHYKKLDTLKSEFVSTVSQDLRAPLTLMRGYATMLGMVGSMNDQQKDFIRKILASVDQMGKLVDNLLDLGRIEAGLGLSLESVQVESLIRDVIGVYRPQAVNKQISLEVALDEDMKAIEVDSTLLRQAIANLIDNAIKYTPAGGRVTIRAEQHDNEQTIGVQDTGGGIAPTDQARLFEKFYSTRRRDTKGEKGLGLGLAIVKSIAEQHGGRVTVESKLGAGSTFRLIIPIRSPLTQTLEGRPREEADQTTSD